MAYIQEMEQVDWSELLMSEYLDFINNTLVTEITKDLDKMAPVKSYQNRNNSKNWVNDKIKSEMKVRDSLREAARVSGSPDDWKMYRTARNQVVKNLGKYKDEYFG